jgi:BirA family transcriptional regulator, biotin operon repressor / biotin---[acetyl-CoA-carboxylase] ligase
MIIGSTREHHEIVSSTNSVAADKLKTEDIPEGLVITASCQENGRGQQGNTWESEAGKNLLMSVIIYPSMVNPEEQFLISQMASLAVFDFIRHETSEVRIKWPNDIYVKDDKIAGILIESSLMGNSIRSSIIGIGLNLNQKRFSSNIPNPISLGNVTGKLYDVEETAGYLSGVLDHRYRMIRNRESKKISGDYLGALYRCCEWHRYKDESGEFTGMVEGIRSNGLLIVRRKNGTSRDYSFKEIEYIF